MTTTEYFRARDRECIKLAHSQPRLSLVDRMRMAEATLTRAGMAKPTAIAARGAGRIRLTAGGDAAVDFEHAVDTVGAALELLNTLVPSSVEWSHLDRFHAAKLLFRIVRDSQMPTTLSKARGEVVFLSLFPGPNKIVKATRALGATDRSFRALPWSDQVRQASTWLKSVNTL